MSTTILLCTLAALIGFPAGYGLAWLVDEAKKEIEGFFYTRVYMLDVFAFWIVEEERRV